MNLMMRTLTVSLILLLALVAGLVSRAELKTFIQTAEAYIGDNQTKNDARNLATLEAKRLALEQAGTYVESLTLVKDAVVEKDEILAFTAGVAQTEILKEEPLVSGESYGLRVTAKVTVDTALLPARIESLKQDSSALELNEQMLERNRQLEEELKKYKAELEKLKSAEQVQALQQQEGQRLEQALGATEWFEKSEAALRAKKWDEVIAYTTKAIEVVPQDPFAYASRGVAYGKTGALDKALADFSKAIQLKPDMAKAYHGRGAVYAKQGKLAAAIVDFSKAIQLKPRFPGSYMARALAYQQKGNCRQARKDAQKACSLGAKKSCKWRCH